MIKLLVLVLVFVNSSFAFDIVDKSYQNLNQQIEILYDSNESYTIQDIPLDKFKSVDNLALGYVNGAVWSKVVLDYQAKNQNILFINPKININIIDVYIFENNNLIATYKLGNYKSVSNNHINSKFSNFQLEIKPNQEYMIISKIKSKSPIDATWIVSNNDKF